MISFNYQTKFSLQNEEKLANWISLVIQSEGYTEGDLMYFFCDDDSLIKLNIEFLNHDTLTDIISFDYVIGKQLNGEIFISVDRVRENSNDLGVGFLEELHRVMIHGILHYCGYGDKSEEEIIVMRAKEDYYLNKI